MKNSEKFIFLFVVIIGAFFARTLYPSLSVSPAVNAGSPSETAMAESTPPLLVLPQTGAANTVAEAGVTATPPSSQQTVNTAPSTPSLFTPVSSTGHTPMPVFNSQAYMIADLTTGAVLSSSNAATRWPTASLTKLMTATVIMDNIATSTLITITPQMFAADPEEATLVIGDTYSVEDLLHLMLMPSSNVAAEAMADYFGHTKFMQEMNTRAQEWGMQNTYFDDTSGISAANESTANDLLILAQHVYNNYPRVLAITDTRTTTITEINSGKNISIASINDFAGEPQFVGGKTGHTVQANGNLLSIFNYDGHPVVIIVLGTSDRFGDSTKLLTWFENNYK